ncbi:hypothetical protein [Aurantiacibacter sp. D1-12]|uniref:hypothetical protein n=1 Tax=Aurantiacibacter sp. D1-12 TaxID=2993658 RepID=UPI00237CFF20|nr:hypothetical protein [Aurantiacibacter sp. D1-12]MDE1468582.1 hypothetical protein [Aurantiacibacter sp. D1-12]
MDDLVLKFGGSLIAISALVVFAHFLGFTRHGKLSSKGEAAHCLRLAAGGFEPVHVFLDREGEAALAQDASGRGAVLAPHGNQFVARILSAGAKLSLEKDRLQISDQSIGLRPIVLRFDNMPPDWVSALADAR